METAITLIIAIPLGILILWKILGICVEDTYKENLIDNGNDYVA